MAEEAEESEDSDFYAPDHEKSQMSLNFDLVHDQDINDMFQGLK